MAARRLNADAYTVGLIYAKPIEMHAITVMLDEIHQPLPMRLGDDNEYTLGRIGKHNVALAGPPRGGQGKAVIADIVGRIRLTFKNIGVGLLVGVGGGVPHLPKDDVRLGDVVVAAPEAGPAVVQYDLGKQLINEVSVTRTLNKPPALLLRVVDKVDDQYQRVEERGKDFFATHLQRFVKFPRIKEQYGRPTSPDQLFLATYHHEDGTDCSSHDLCYEVKRPDRELPGEIRVHYSTILSGDLVMKSGEIRDQLSTKFCNALCFEMEAAGLMDVFPCLVIRGICDYSDSHKNKVWQGYAAATAAAYAREILLSMAERTIGGALGVSPVSTRQADCLPISDSRVDKTSATPKPKYVLTNIPYTIDDIKLASLVPSIENPHQDALAAPRRLREGEDFGCRSQQDFKLLLNFNEKFFHRFQMTRLSSFFGGRRHDDNVQLWCREGRVYELKQPKDLFVELCKYDAVRKWLLQTIDGGDDVYFVVGFCSFIDARMVDEIAAPSGVPDSAGALAGGRAAASFSEGQSFQIPGERIYKVCFRKVHFRWFFGRDVQSCHLKRSNCWIVTPSRQTTAEKRDNAVEASLEENEGGDEIHFEKVETDGGQE